MIAGSTRVSSCTLRPVARREAVLQRRHGDPPAAPIAVVSSARTIFAVIHQPLAVRRGQLRQQRQPIALGEQQQQLRRRSAIQARPARAAARRPRACAARHRRDSTARAHQQLVAGHESGELRELALEPGRGRPLLQRDVEQRARVARRRPRGWSSRLLQLRRVAVDQPELILGRDVPAMRSSATLTASCAACSVNSRRAMRSCMSISRRVCSSSRSRSVAAACAMRSCSAARPPRPALLQRVELRRAAPSALPRSPRAARSPSPHLRRGDEVLANLRCRASQISGRAACCRK